MSSKRVLDAALIPLVGLLTFLLLVAFRIDVPAHLDFGQLYRSVVALASGEHLYHVSDADITRLSSQSSLSGELPFPGPPWYAALAYPLHTLSAETAAKMWMAFSLAALLGTIKLVVPNLSLRAQAIVFILAIVSAPVQGHLIVGQFTLPALLGMALTLSGITQGSSTKSALGLALTTFRPHLGLPFAACTVAGLLATQRQHGFRVCTTFLLILTLLIGLALTVDPQSISRYPEYLKLLNNFPSNKVCDTCSSIPILTERLCNSPHDVWRARFLIGASVGVSLAGLLLRVRRCPDLFIAGMTCAAMLAAPYVRNYDFVLLILPFCIVVERLLSGNHSHVAILALTTVVAYLIAGILPYFIPRALQGKVLVFAPALLYLSCHLLRRCCPAYSPAYAVPPTLPAVPLPSPLNRR